VSEPEEEASDETADCADDTSQYTSYPATTLDAAIVLKLDADDGKSVESFVARPQEIPVPPVIQDLNVELPLRRHLVSNTQGGVVGYCQSRRITCVDRLRAGGGVKACVDV
uniref:Uncharacterized protein n=1 Tax=Triticum urartu TaxID=4572 RepID=A0A8R7PQM5_TRIUA